MGIGLGPDSYAIIEQGRIGQILSSKPMDRRSIIEEAAGVTMYKSKRWLAETKLEASKGNLARVSDILLGSGQTIGVAETSGEQGAALCGIARRASRPATAPIWKQGGALETKQRG